MIALYWGILDGLLALCNQTDKSTDAYYYR